VARVLFLSVLLRILHNSSGTITINDLDLSSIPQEPFILSGSVRLNVDLTGLAPDDIIIAALTKVGLWTILESRGGLDTEMTATHFLKASNKSSILQERCSTKGAGF